LKGFQPVTTSFQRFAWRALALMQLAGIVALVGVSVLLAAGTLPGFLGFESFVVSTNSMDPTIQVGALAVVSPVKVEQLTAGDIITYRKPADPDMLVVQRLLFVDAEATDKLNLQTRGDSEPASEQVSVLPHVTLGRVMYAIPGIGLLVDFLNQPLGKVLLLAAPVVFLAGDYLLSRVRRRRSVVVTVDQMPRIDALLDYGRRALQSAHPHLALRAAQGVLSLDANNEAALGLNARALLALEDAREHAAA
jgi:signal peptidase